MENNNELKNEILKGDIGPTSIKLAIPVMIGQILLLIYGIVDLTFISMLDKTSTALVTGIGLVFPIYMFYLALGIGLFTGISVLVARAIGERNKHVLDLVSDSGIIISLVIMVFSLALFYGFGEDIINLLAGSKISETAINAGIDYLYFIVPGLSLLLFNQMLLGILQGEGMVKPYAVSMFLSTFLNMALSPLFIFTFNMGVAGSAIATSISIAVSTVYILGVFVKKKNSVPIHWKLSDAKMDLIKEILRIGLAHVMSLFIINIGSIFINYIIGSISETAMNSWVLVIRMDEFLLFVGYAFGSSTLTMVGQNFGVGNTLRVSEIFKKNISLAGIVGLVFVVIYNLIAPYLFSLFTDVQAVIDGCVFQVKVLSLTYIAIIITIVINSTFQATGRALPGVLLEIIRMLVITIPVAYITVYVYGMGVGSVFLTIGCANVFVFLVGWLWSHGYVNKMIKPA